jgi:glycosyltransferase involved in cell wall biosynthesis
VGRGYDAAILCNAANAFVAWVPRVVGTQVVLNVDGLERQRRKWNAVGRAWYRVSETLSTWLPSAIVTDARVIQRYYHERYATASTYIAYGAHTDRATTQEALNRLGLTPGRYVLYVSRLEPENNALAVIEGHEASGLDVPLVIVGDAPYASAYIASLKARAGAGVRFAGAIYGSGYRELQSHALAYVHATEVGGTHPALIEAMGLGGVVLVHDEPANRETAGEAARYFNAHQPDTLAAALREVAGDRTLRDRLRTAARARVLALYSWDTVTDAYEALCQRLVNGQGTRPLVAAESRP